VKYSYQVFYRKPPAGMAGYMVVNTAEAAQEEKLRLERHGYVVTSILPPEEEGCER
jgi:hypothetical protein